VNCAVLYCTVLFRSASSSVLPLILFYLLFCTVLHLLLFCSVLLCSTPYSVLSYLFYLFYFTSYSVLFCSVLFYFLSCAFPALSCPVLFCPVLYCPVLSWSVMFSSPSIFYQQLFRILFNILSLLHRNISFTFFSLCYISVILCYWLFYYYSHKCELFIISP
jgi:hypothetical protein